MRFDLNSNLLGQARAVLEKRKRVYWIVGGACAGKSTISRAISARYGIPLYDVDAHVFDDYPNRCIWERHPAIKTWFTAPDPFAWLLGLPEDEFIEFNRAANAEYLDLLADDLAGMAPNQAMVIDGGVTNPGLLAEVMRVEQIVCVATTEAMSVQAWEESADRRFMKEMVYQLPEPEEAWNKFLRFDQLMTRIILEECRQAGIRIYFRTEATSTDSLVKQISIALAGQGEL